MTDNNPPASYVATLRITPQFVVAMVCIGLFLALSVSLSVVAVQDQPSAIVERVLYLSSVAAMPAYFAAIGLLALKPFVGDRVALRVDQEGVSLGSLAIHFRVPKVVTVPWSDIAEIILFTTYAPPIGRLVGGHARCIGVRLRPGAALPPGEPKHDSIWHPLARGKRTGLADVCRPVSNLWQLDRSRLLAAAKTYAADVPVIDLW
jgi:hypothetical protein